MVRDLIQNSLTLCHTKVKICHYLFIFMSFHYFLPPSHTASAKTSEDFKYSTHLKHRYDAFMLFFVTVAQVLKKCIYRRKRQM